MGLYDTKEAELYKTGMQNVEKILDVNAEDYREKGFSEAEISEQLKLDRISEMNEFIKDAFPNENKDDFDENDIKEMKEI